MFLCLIILRDLRDQWMIEILSEEMSAAWVSNNFQPIPLKVSFHTKKQICCQWVVTVRIYKQLKPFWLSQCCKNRSTFPPKSLLLPAATEADKKGAGPWNGFYGGAPSKCVFRDSEWSSMSSGPDEDVNKKISSVAGYLQTEKTDQPCLLASMQHCHNSLRGYTGPKESWRGRLLVTSKTYTLLHQPARCKSSHQCWTGQWVEPKGVQAGA